MKSIWKIIFYVTLLIIIVIEVITFLFMLSDLNDQREKCVSEYGGKVAQGYCIYIENGTSKHYNLRNTNLPIGGG